MAIFTSLIQLSFLFSCKLLLHIVGLKMCSLPSSELKSPKPHVVSPELIEHTFQFLVEAVLHTLFYPLLGHDILEQ
jgi:hypothetical protein